MSTFENKNYRWRETYFVLFDAKKRPKLSSVVKAIGELNSRYELVNPLADAKGHIESLTVLSADDYAAMDICYIEGEEVLEQAPDLVKDLKKSADGRLSRFSALEHPHLRRPFRRAALRTHRRRVRRGGRATKCSIPARC